MLRDGKPVPIPVVAGLDDDTYTEIVKGDLQPGEQVITAEQRNASGGGGGATTGVRLRL